MTKFPFLRWDYAPRRSVFGGGGGGQQAALMQQIATQQAAAAVTANARAITDAQGRSLAAISQQQAKDDVEIASLNKPGIGRAMLAAPRRTLGG